MSPLWRRRIKKTLIVMAISIPVMVLGLYIAVHTFPSFGPWLADGLRAIIGVEAVSRLEEFTYRTEDRFNVWWREDEEPQVYWDIPSSEPAPSGSGRQFRPPDVGPALKQLAGKGDGTWVAVPDALQPDTPVMWKTLIHPDPKRPWAEIFIVAFDLALIDLHAVAGTAEPKAITEEGRAYKRHGLIAGDHQATLIAAFNGGFKYEHGHWGMHVEGVTLLPLRKLGCTVGKQKDGTIVIEEYSGGDTFAESLWWRQTPPCMFRSGKRHGGLWDPDSRNWGAALGGDTVIRRSAIGLDESRTTLFMGVSNHTAAVAMADGMRHAGAVDVAQLDINWSFPRIVVFKREGDTLTTESLFPGFKVEPDEYVRAPCPRDYFYVTRKKP